MKLTELALRFMRIGATGFGGPMALIGLMHQRFVEKDGAVSADEFATGVALGQILPGPVAVDCATHLGLRLHGFVGACVSTVSLILPPFLLMLILTPLYFRYGQVPQAVGFLKGVAPAIIAVIIMAGHNLITKMRLDVLGGAIVALATVGVVVKVSPVLLILGAGLLGMLFRSRAKAGRDAG